MWIFWTCIFFPPRSQWCPMLNEPWTSPWISIQCLYFGRRFLPMHSYVPNFSKCMKVAKLAVLQIMGYVEDKKTFSTLIFMKMIANLTRWAFRFVVAYVCITIIYCWHFSLWWCHNSLNKWNNKKLVAWCVLASIAHYNKQHLVFVMLISLSSSSRWISSPFSIWFLCIIELMYGLQVRIVCCHWVHCPLRQGFNSLTQLVIFFH